MVMKNVKTRLKHYLKEYWRVLRLTKKPSMPEFKSIVKISGLGMAIIGFIGFLITMVRQVLF
ncbi:MAG: protein translocase SEC61 complex subunit gamma [Candidatus Woesearchaeota archaeon]